MGVCALQTAAECWSLVPLGAPGAVSRGRLLRGNSQGVVQVAPLAYLLHAPTLCCAEGGGSSNAGIHRSEVAGL